MSVIYTLFNSTGKFVSFCFTEDMKTYIDGGIYGEIPLEMWIIEYDTNKMIPVLDTVNNTILWVSGSLPKV